jgi:multidrug efflux pump subunit AcrA (membrane-fusion protein)
MYATLVAFTVAALGQLGAEPTPPASSAPASTPALPPAATPGPTTVASPGLNGNCELKHVTINSDHDVVISAEVEGTLTKLPIKEGVRVEARQLLGAIDDRQALAAL